MHSREALVHVFHAGLSTSFFRGLEHSTSSYGGPLELEVDGMDLAQPLHRVATIAVDHLRPLGLPWRFSELPLVYGLRYSDCRLHYTFEPGAIVPSSMEPREPTEDWPYAGYPQLLPFVPLEPGPIAPSTWEEFRQRAPSLPERPLLELVVLVPPPATLGFSMWGRMGDAEGATIVFECSLQEKRVLAYNVGT